MSLVKSTRILTFVMLLFVGVGCATMSEDQELKLGREAHGQFEAEFGGPIKDEEIQKYVNAVGMDMVRYANRPKMDWRFTVLNSDQINAFAVPGGYIYITQGLLSRMSNEAELAGTLGHEIGHIAHRHSVRQIQKAQQAQGAAIGAGILGAVFGVEGVGDLAGVVANLSLMSYGRDQEREADMSGLEFMSQAGYNPKGLVETMKVLQQAAAGQEPPEFLSTHPNPGNRIEYLTETIEEKYAQAAQSGKYGEETFEKIVKSRLGLWFKIDVTQPVAWCGTCRKESAER